MARLDFAALEETRTSGTPPHAFTTVRYSLTPVGHLNLGKFWKWILARHFRLHQEGALGPH